MTNACETKYFSTIVKRVLISKPERDGATCTKMYLSVYFDEGTIVVYLIVTVPIY